MKSIFEKYAPFIQDFIYQNQWESLRAIQVAAGEAIFNTDEHVLLLGSTASGKTEAAFFPILSLFYQKMPQSIGAIYIGPLKALINDQFMRLTELCEQAHIPVWHWHGDVSYAHKQKMIQNPSGILQITPESLEALLLHKHGMITKLFSDLQFIVIDEVHSLLRNDRGGQTLCLIERLSKIAKVEPRRIGLSATLGNPKEVGELLSLGTNKRTLIPQIVAYPVKWRLSLQHFYVQNETLSDEEKAKGLPCLDQKSDQAPAFADPGLGYIFEHTKGKKCLVFTNSREECEMVTSTLRHYCEVQHEPDRFLIHHGNLSASYRETAEEIMKDETQFQTTVTTATLELGIDIGRLQRAFQIDAPAMVSSFLQRMGRTGRRNLPPEMWFVIREELPTTREMLPATIPWKLIQAIALIQLYIEEKWIEPLRVSSHPYSLLYHQTMSILASNGELTPSVLASKVLSLAYFRFVSLEDYQDLLRHLVQIDHIQKTENGGLIIGLAGERIIHSFKFYAVFQENEEYVVRCHSQELGSIVKPPPVGDKIALAGKVWTVEEIDYKKHVIYCEEAKGQVPAYFGLCPGDIHTKVLEKMYQILNEKTIYPYLMNQAIVRLNEGRKIVSSASLMEDPLICLGGDMYALFPWLGTYSFLALERFLKIKCASRLGLKKMDVSRPYFMQFTMKVSFQEFYEILLDESKKPIEPLDLVYPKEVPLFEKYDEYVPVNLIKKGFAYGVLDIQGMLKRIQNWKKR